METVWIVFWLYQIFYVGSNQTMCKSIKWNKNRVTVNIDQSTVKIDVILAVDDG